MADAISGGTTGAQAGAAIGSIVPGVGTAIGSVAGGLLGGIVGLFSGNSAKKKAEAAYAEAERLIKEVGAGPDLAREIMLDQFKVEGIYTPELEQKLDLEMSKAAQIQEDPSLGSSQRKALEILSGAAQSGLGPEERAELAQLQDEQAAQTRGQEQSIIQDMQQRGQGGSGAELIARLNAGQQSANRSRSAGLDIAAQASRRALEAAGQMGSLSGNIRGQEFDINKAKADAEDLRNQMLYQNSVTMQTRNIDAKNAAERANLVNAQQTSNRNVVQSNAEKERQRQAEQTMYENKAGQLGRLADLKTGAAARATASGQSSANKWGMLGDIAGKGLGLASDAGLFKSDARKTEDFVNKAADLEVKDADEQRKKAIAGLGQA